MGGDHGDGEISPSQRIDFVTMGMFIIGMCDSCTAVELAFSSFPRSVGYPVAGKCLDFASSSARWSDFKVQENDGHRALE